MRTYKRQQEILEYLEECQYATVSELAGKVFASEASVRRDIAALESKGYVSKIYGGRNAAVRFCLPCAQRHFPSAPFD